MKPCITRSITAAGLALAAVLAQAQEVVFKVHHPLPPTSNSHQNLITPWCNKIAAESGGRMKCQIYPAMQLGGTPPQLVDQVIDGVADIIWTVPTYQSGRFNKAEVFELPFMTTTAEKASPALWEYIQKHALDEFKGTKLILAHVHDGSILHFRKSQVRSLEDLKGLKVRAPTRIGTRFLSAIGATPVSMPIPSVPEALAKGVVDGALVPWEVMTPFKLQEVTAVHVEGPQGAAKMSNSIFIMAINQARYDRLPADLKKIIDQNSGLETSRWAGKVFDGPEPAARKISVERKNTFISLTPEEYKRWQQAAATVDEEWIKEMSGRGVNGKALLEDAQALLKKYR